MENLDLLPHLWGCRIAEYEFDIVASSVILSVYCPRSSGVTEHYNVRMRQVLSFSFQHDVRFTTREHLIEPWRYIDLSSIEASRVTIGVEQYWKVEAELWSAVLEVICGELHVTRGLTVDTKTE